jgi:surfeit locus 1 family protein
MCAGANRVAKLRPWVVLGAALLLMVLTARLGFWQLDRAAQKTRLQQAQDQQQNLPVLTAAELARNIETLAPQLHRRVEIEGRWLAEYTVYLDNRPMNGRVGFFAVTPLLLHDGSAVLVQRGWLPRDLLDRTRIVASPAPVGPQRVAGRIALEPSRLFEFEPAHRGTIRQNLDVVAFGRETGLPLRPLTVVQEADSPDLAASPDGLLRHWARPTQGVDKHYGYAAQWFALSALTAGLWLWFQVLAPRRLGAAAKAAPPSSGPTA